MDGRKFKLTVRLFQYEEEWLQAEAKRRGWINRQNVIRMWINDQIKRETAKQAIKEKVDGS